MDDDLELAAYITAYEAWWNASQVYENLASKANDGDLNDKNRLQTLLLDLNVLERDYLKKRARLESLNDYESLQNAEDIQPAPEYKIKAIFQWLLR
jgi:hypothetical protein